MRRSSFFAIALLASIGSATEVRRVQFPAPSPDGKTLVFSWQGDLWKVSMSGGRAERLTVHPANDTYPRFTPDGQRIVFASNRFGNNDIFSIKVDGTDVRRITQESATEVPTGISPDGKYVYGHTTAFGRMDLFRVGINGGDLVRLTDHPLESEFSATVSPDGTKVYYNRGSYGPLVWRKPGVVGTAVGDIWVADNTVPLSNHKNLTKSDASELLPNILSDGSMVYQSNKSGWPNIYRGSKQLTNHTNGTVRNLQVSGNGKTVVYEFNSDIYALDLATGKYEKVAIDVPDDQRVNPNADLTITTGVQEFAVSADGKRTVLQVRGELFLIPEKGGTTRRLTNNVAMDHSPIWIDAKTILYVAADMQGSRSFKTVTIDGEVKNFLTDAEDLTHPTLSPDGKTVAFHKGTTQICLVPVAGGTKKDLVTGNFVDVLDGDPKFSWSPDSKYLVVDIPTDRGSKVDVISIDGAKRVTVAWTARGTGQAPRFTPNGKGVYFTAREFENTELFLVDLVPQETTFTEDDLDKIDSPKPKPAEPAVDIFSPWIERRMRRLTSANTSNVLANAEGRAFYATVDGKFSTVSLTGSVTPIETVTGFASNLSVGSGKIYFINSGRLVALAQGAPAPTPINFSAQMSLNLKDEEIALFNEIWWGIDRMYYDPKFHGKDWKAIREKFAKVVPYCYDRNDFYAAMGEMVEELDSSHLGATAPPSESFGNDSTAFLGVTFDPKVLDSRGVYIVNRVYTASAASLPQSQLIEGDRIVSVDGVKPGPSVPIASLLNRKAGKKVQLLVERGGKELQILIKPDSSAAKSSLEYEDFVSSQRELVKKLSGGKLAYFHIQGMDEASYLRFLREIRIYGPETEGGIIDVRYNGGGSTSHKILGVLIKTPWLIRTTRGPEGIRLSENIFRGDSYEQPTALMMNSYSFSNAEIMGEGVRKLNRGPIIGERTPGYVIGTGAYRLWDGGMIRMPSIGAYSVDGENLENNGRKPDFNVPFDPDAWTQGRDPQTEKAVQELLKRLKG